MLRNRPQRVFWAVVLGDVLAMATVLGVWMRLQPFAPRLEVTIWLEVSIALPLVYVVLACIGRVHASIRAVRPMELLGRSFVFWLQILAGIALFHLLVDPHLPHSWGAARMRELACLTISGLTLPTLVVFRAIVLFACRWMQGGGRSLRKVVIAGTGDTARITAYEIQRHPDWGIELLGYLDTSDHPDRVMNQPGMKVLGHYRDLPELVKKQVVDEIVVADPCATIEAVEEVVRISETIGLRAFVLADFCQTKSTTIDRTDLAGRTLLVLTPFPDRIVGGTFKRAVDIVGSAAGLLMLSPLLISVAIAIKLTSPGSIFFTQTRVGRNGRTFKMFKFRTMVADADRLKNDLMAHNEMDGPVFKMKRDPRVTKVGRFLRRYSIDEFPQLWNVLKGDMSLVGPRPPVPEEVAVYETWQRRRLSMKPGLTCIWQVTGRNNTDFETWMRQDLDYIDNWSFAEDIKILLRTVPAVLTGRGAS